LGIIDVNVDEIDQLLIRYSASAWKS